MRRIKFHKHLYVGAGVLFLMIFLSFTAKAQIKVTGHVTDAGTGSPLAGVTVTVMETSKATQTDDQGSYNIETDANTTLLFTSVNYEAHTVSVDGKTRIDVSMTQSMEQLSEVVINIGYGSSRKEDLTGSVTQVSADDFQSGQITSPEQLISGKVAGVQITRNSGAPGSGSTIRIRGGASLNASNDPLIVIDGVPLSNDGIPGAPSGLSLINPDDVESFTVLKDASATAIYGSRASNGVIIITTKGGMAGRKPKFNVSSNSSLSVLPHNVSVISPEHFRSVVRDFGSQQYIDRLGDANTDWQSLIYHKAFTIDNNISMTGGLKNMPYRVSLGYLDQKGVLRTGKLDRYSGAINVTPTLLNDHLKIDINLKGSLSHSRFANQGAIGASVFFDPTKPVYSGTNKYNGYWEWTDPNATNGLLNLAPLNPLGLLMDRHDLSNVRRSIGNALIDYKVHFLPDLHLFLNLGYDYSLGRGTIFVDSTAAQSYLRSPDGLHSGEDNQYRQIRKDKLLEAYFNYSKRIESLDIRVELVGGYGYQDFFTRNYNYSDRTADGFEIPTSIPIFPFDEDQWTLISYYGRANINIKNRYLLTGTIRTDGSSKFAKDQRWSVFPSGALAWNAKEENFLVNSKVVSTMKLRLGYGETGQQMGIGLYDYKPIYLLSTNTSQYQLGDQYYHMLAPQGYFAQRTWEETTTENLGLDFGFLNDRISGSVDFYYKRTHHLLNEINQPAGSNFSNRIIANVGSMTNKGVELSLNFQPVKNENWVWDLSFNGTYNENKITKLTINEDPDFEGVRFMGISGGTGSLIMVNSVGYPRGSFYVYKQVYDPGGRPIDGLMEDINRDGIINEKDLYRYKSPDPSYILGMSTNINYKNKLNMGFVMRTNIGNYAYQNNIASSSTLRNILNPIGFLANGVNYFLAPGSGDKYFLSDYYIWNASFLKMDNIYANYTFRNVFRNDKNTLTISANLQNVFTITNYFGLDPEISSGVDNNLYPVPRTVSLGVSLGF